jgi:hypothetical protein
MKQSTLEEEIESKDAEIKQLKDRIAYLEQITDEYHYLQAHPQMSVMDFTMMQNERAQKARIENERRRKEAEQAQLEEARIHKLEVERKPKIEQAKQELQSWYDEQLSVIDSFMTASTDELNEYLSRDYVYVEDPLTGEISIPDRKPVVEESPVGRAIKKSTGIGYECDICNFSAVPISGIEGYIYQQRDTHRQPILDVLNKEWDNKAFQKVLDDEESSR